MREELKGFRVHTSSRTNASWNKKYLEQKEHYKFDLAISSRNIPMFDFDDGTLEDVLRTEKEIRAILWNVLDNQTRNRIGSIDNIKFAIFKTKHGYHLIYGIRLPYSSWLLLYRAINLVCSKFKYLDCVHVKASIDRDYTTLRMDRDTKLVYTTADVNKVKELYINNLRKKYSEEMLKKLKVVE
jgi:hypothetical protein